MLYKPEAFEPLTETPWRAGRVSAQVREVVHATATPFDPDALWPPDSRDAEGVAPPLTNLYSGSAGVVYALERVRRVAESRLDLPAIAVRGVESWREQPDYPERLDEPPVRTHASLFFGETGPLWIASSLTRDRSLEDDLHARVVENVEAPANELMWASVGTLLVAKRMLDLTADERWAEAWRATAEVLWERRDEEGLWATEPFGRGLGAAHGASTTAAVLLDGRDLLGLERAEELAAETAAALRRHAVVEDELANWPMVAGDDLVGYDGQTRVQWCHGAAGVVSSAASYLDQDLLLAGAELCWRAGPPRLEKGPGLCHGTAGTGYALLKVFERTGDERWLERARRFAVHALEQVERLGEIRHSLFTGAIGAAVFADDCLGAEARFPILDRVERS